MTAFGNNSLTISVNVIHDKTYAKQYIRTSDVLINVFKVEVSFLRLRKYIFLTIILPPISLINVYNSLWDEIDSLLFYCSISAF